MFEFGSVVRNGTGHWRGDLGGTPPGVELSNEGRTRDEWQVAAEFCLAIVAVMDSERSALRGRIEELLDTPLPHVDVVDRLTDLLGGG